VQPTPGRPCPNHHRAATPRTPSCWFAPLKRDARDRLGCDDAQAGGTYRCTLASPPTQERLSDYTGSKQLLAVRGVVSGGCIGRDGAGLHWDCYIGDKAVAHGILVHDLLGQKLTGPTAG
jgi:hypothetical protein